MIKRIEHACNFGSFKDFNWPNGLHPFEHINLFYGRNYAGKTTLSRIFSALETGQLDQPGSTVDFQRQDKTILHLSNSKLKEESNDYSKNIRVFNEDYIKEYLSFMYYDNEGMVPFAILGRENVALEVDINNLQRQLGTRKQDGEFTEGLHRNLGITKKDHTNKYEKWKSAEDSLTEEKRKKSTTGTKSIKSQHSIFGDINYNIASIKRDIKLVGMKDYTPLTAEQAQSYQVSIKEEEKDNIEFNIPSMLLESHILKANTLLKKTLTKEDKLEELLKDSLISDWVKEGMALHKDKSHCLFCTELLSEERINQLNSHFDEESLAFEKEIKVLVQQIEKEKDKLQNLKFNNNNLYSTFHSSADNIQSKIESYLTDYYSIQDSLIEVLNDKQKNLSNPTTTFDNKLPFIAQLTTSLKSINR